MIDANLNRASEGLRTCEDLARFLLDDASLAREAKHLRHALIRIVIDAAGGDRLALLAARDSEQDVGPGVQRPPSQSPRVSLGEIAPAAAQRVQQALRVLEETAGLLGPQGAAAAMQIEQLRYRTYTLDQSLSAKLASLAGAAQTARGVQWKLCVLITESLCHHPWKVVASAAMQAGADCLQLREKQLSDGELLGRARWLVEESRRYAHTPAIMINDRVDIALVSGADGVHLGQDDLSPVDARRLCDHAGRSLRIGLSTHDAAELDAAIHQPIDYVGLGAIFTTATKPRSISGPAYLEQALTRLQAHAQEGRGAIGHLAIGGLTAPRARELTHLGCRGFAVSSAICSAQDPEQATRGFLGT